MHPRVRGGKGYEYRRAYVRVKDEIRVYMELYTELGWNHGDVVPMDDVAVY